MTHEFDFGNRAPTWEQRARHLTRFPAPTRVGNVIAVDFSQAAARRGATWNGTPIDQAPPWALPEDENYPYDDDNFFPF